MYEGDQGQTGGRWLGAGGYPFFLFGCLAPVPLGSEWAGLRRLAAAVFSSDRSRVPDDI